MKKRVTSLLLSIALLLTMLPTVAFAADAVSIVASPSEVSAGDEFTVTLSIPAVEDKAYSAAFRIGFNKDVFEVTSFTAPTITGGTLTAFSSADEANSAGEVSCSYEGTAQENTIDLTQGVEMSVTFAVKADATAAEYDFTVDSQKNYAKSVASDGYTETELISIASGLKATVSVTNGSSGEDSTSGYTVEVANSSSDLVAVNGNIALNVNVNNTFNSAKITLSYDTSYLTFVNGTVASNQTMGEKDQAVSITGSNGVITIIDYGTAFTSGTAYTLNFTAAAATTGSDVKVTYAGLSTEEKAAVEDLTVATSLGTVSVPVGYTVSVPTATDDYTFTASANTVVPGGSVDITVNNPYYDYVLTATGGTLSATESGWTVSNVTGNVEVSVTSATPKSFNVTVKTVDKDGNAIDGIDDVVTTNGATYGTSYSYTLPNNVEVVGGVGTQYTLSSITVGGNSATYTSSGRTYTIQGANVTGDIVVTVTKQDLDPNAFTVSVEGETSAGTLEATQVDKNGTAKLTLNNKEAGYTYTVTATMGGSPVTPTQSDDVYTVSGVTGNVVFSISKTLDTTSLSVSQYVQLDGTVMWLVKINGNGTEQISGKTYTYDGNNMFWSSKYEAYCYLIVEATDPYNNADESAKAAFTAKFGMTDTAAVAINYNGNVNLTTNDGTAVIDVNDAQLVWNMYSAVYSGIDTNVTVQKFLEADMDSTVGLSTNDAAEVVKLIG